MEITNEIIDKVATLAKLEFKDEDREAMKKDLSQIISFVDKLNEVDLSNYEPLIYMSDEVNIMRTDEMKHDITQKEALMNAPRHDSDYFKVPKVLGANPETGE